MAEHHPLGDIEYLSENLLKSYLPGFPIIKELVQNAEDAKATRLDYGWIEGIPDATHPLLRSPALFMLDNGEFTNKNAESIRYILGGSSKPNQQDSIGKFGLGLKSVFHLCEAFFYIAPDPQNSDYPGSNIFNPWAGAMNKDKYHAGWDHFLPEDKDLMKMALQQILEKKHYQEKWFILWIPLRQRSHRTIENQEDSVPLWIKNGENEFFDKDKGIPDFLSNKETKKELNILMTLLETVNEISYWENDLSEPRFEITVKPTSQRRCSLSKLGQNSKNLIKGQITDGVNILDFFGHEIISESSEFNNLVKSSEFPGKFRSIKPHNAIVFSRLNDNFADSKHSLTLRTAVFLPIGEDRAIECQSQYSYYLTLHGYFFVDFARTGVLGWDKNSLNIDKNKKPGDDDRILLEKEWNFYLYEVILTCILDTFAKFVDENSLSESEISEICKALLKSQLFTNSSNREKICQNQQFVLCITPQGKQWKLLDKNIKVLPLRQVPNWDFFPNIMALSQSCNYILTLSHAPNLRFENTTFDRWNDTEIIYALSNVSEAKILHNHIAINYLVLFIKECCQNPRTHKIESDNVQKHLIQFVKKGLIQLKWNELNSEIKNSLENLITLIRDSEVFYIDASENLFKHILQINVSRLLLPKLLFNCSHNYSLKELNFQDAKTFLSNLNDLITRWEKQGENTKNIERIVKDFLNLSKNYIINILSTNPYWRCLIGSQYPQKTAIFYSYHQFQEFKRKSILFKESNKSLINSLVEATENIQPIIVDSKIADLLKNDENISPVICNVDTCKSSLSKTPALAKPDRRKQLLTELLKEVR
ncbi:sacsin N-terminal ATP-binding-like domain-containing protein [Nostoc sp. 2RC]|uniref:sacsin N-terminal ATP-binding-like domain-containing protein n=1 Tax=Nostoc sp. 2RC TaxID=2485484 RepID=UPI00162985EF|nr:hypothetical protein [Nostoc sp. 2RC]MBC1236659.1 hypothetical protein [Nostoc sp. 2RC]